jgi:hypothetical protein
VERPDVLQHELRGIAVLAIDVLLDVETNNIVAFRKQSFSPPAQAAVQINRQWFHATIGSM